MHKHRWILQNNTGLLASYVWFCRDCTSQCVQLKRVFKARVTMSDNQSAINKEK